MRANVRVTTPLASKRYRTKLEGGNQKSQIWLNLKSHKITNEIK
jgi:hypothetical protein